MNYVVLINCLQTGVIYECATECFPRKECAGFSYKETTPGGVAECYLSVNCEETFTYEQGSVYFQKAKR